MIESFINHEIERKNVILYVSLWLIIRLSIVWGVVVVAVLLSSCAVALKMRTTIKNLVDSIMTQFF